MAYRLDARFSDLSRNLVLNSAPCEPGLRKAISRLIADDQILYKTADQAFTSNTTLANDADLVFNMLANGVYTVELNYFITATTNGGYNMDLDGGTATVTTLVGNYDRKSASAIAVAQVSALATDNGVTALATLGVTFTGTIIVNAPGTFIPRLAQNASHADTTTFLKGSWGRVVRIAAR